MKRISILLGMALSLSAFALPTQNPNELIQMPIKGEMIIKVKAHAFKSLKTTFKAQEILADNEGVIAQVKTTNYVNVKALLKSDDVIWAQPNYEYIGNPMEGAVNDPRFGEQYHHVMIKSTQAWDIEMGSSEVVVAVTDNGFHLEHDDLKNSYWKNTDEIPGNGIDDDNNGYVDDYEGWDFSDDDNDPRSTGNPHGTHVAGIIAAEANNGIGVAGIAPGVKVMPIQFYGGSNRWTSTIVANSYKYAVNNGAKIINTSYNIDGFVNDNLYIDTVKWIRANNVLLFNSAGNGSRQNPPRQKFEEVILTCSVKSGSASDADTVSRFSNTGTGIDICAPGDPILATVNGEYQGASRYGELSGTSMAAPSAAAVAALIWSKYPEFTAVQVLEKLQATADNIDDRNTRRRGMLGAGRVNAYRALTE